MIKNEKINWEKVKNFVPGEFSEDPDKYADPDLIYTLDNFRSVYGNLIYPSKVKGALARFSGNVNSKHYARKRLSTAIDIFPEGVPFYFLTIALQFDKIGAIGIYLHTTGPDAKPWIMFHIDTRTYQNKKLIWITEKALNVETGRIENKYNYPKNNSEQWKLLRDKRFFTRRVFE